MIKNKKSRGNGEGTIYFNKTKNLWVMQYTIGKTQEGKIKRKTLYGKTRKDVKLKLEKLIAEINTNSFIDKSTIILKDLTLSIIDYEFKMNKLTECSYIRKKESYKIICSHYIANMEIQRIKEYDVKDFLNSLINYSNSTISKVYGLLNTSFKKAVRKNIIPFNFLDDKDDFFIPKSKRQDKKIRSFTLDEEKKLINVLKNNDILYKHQYLLELFTGMRMGEINALSISDIDFKENKIYINKTITKNLQDISIIGHKTKTRKSKRIIPIDSQIKSILEDYFKNHYKENPQQLVFFDHRKNSVISTSQVNCAFKRMCEKYNITQDNVNQHMLRHTFATREIEAGVPAHILKELLGHEEISTTLDTYTDIFNKYKEEHAKIFNEYMRNNELLYI